MGYQPAAEYQQANEPTGEMQRFQLTNLAQITQLCVSLVWYAEARRSVPAQGWELLSWGCLASGISDWRVYFFRFFFLIQSGAASPEICCFLKLKSVFCMHFGARIYIRQH
jgi:hypothetical protein